MSILSEIQSKLHAPKAQDNKFGKYKYRSCEDIVEAVKPILAEYELHLTISDEIISICDRVYVKATAVISDGEKVSYTATASARESLLKKGMDEAQITGAASSYARKYALNGLLAIDDTKDADALNDNTAFRWKKGEKDELFVKVNEALEQQNDQEIKDLFNIYDSPESKTAAWYIFDSATRAKLKEAMK